MSLCDIKSWHPYGSSHSLLLLLYFNFTNIRSPKVWEPHFTSSSMTQWNSVKTFQRFWRWAIRFKFFSDRCHWQVCMTSSFIPLSMVRKRLSFLMPCSFETSCISLLTTRNSYFSIGFASHAKPVNSLMHLPGAGSMIFKPWGNVLQIQKSPLGTQGVGGNCPCVYSQGL